MFYKNNINITPSIKIQKIVVCNVYNLPKTFFTLIITLKKIFHIWTPIFFNYIKNTFLTIFTSLIGSDILSNKD